MVADMGFGFKSRIGQGRKKLAGGGAAGALTGLTAEGAEGAERSRSGTAPK